MRNKHLLLTLAALLLPPTLAGAATLDRLTATADCNAWNSEVTITFRPGATDVLLVFSMQLADSAGVEIERFDFEEWLTIPGTSSATYPFGAAWQAALDRNANVVVSADVYDARGDAINVTGDEVLVPLSCADGSGGTPDETCAHATRWWLRHRNEWPVASVELGGVTYEARQLERLLRLAHRGLVGHRLAHQLAVAKLNLANGVQDDIGPVVAAADAWLAAHPLSTSGRVREPRHAERREALRLIKDLHRWNHSGCPENPTVVQGDDDEEIIKDGLGFDFGGADQEFTGDIGDYETTGKAAEETTSLGSLKAMYR